MMAGVASAPNGGKGNKGCRQKSTGHRIVQDTILWHSDSALTTISYLSYDYDQCREQPMIAGSALPTGLDGHLYHIISESTHGKACPSKKRPRPGVGDGYSVSGNGFADNFCKGFMFIPADQHSRDIQEECSVQQLLEFSRRPVGIGFPIVIPYPLTSTACDAVSTGRSVRISQYSLIFYGYDGWGSLLFSSRCNKNDNVRMKSVLDDYNSNEHILVIEVHHDGLHFLPSEMEAVCQSSIQATMNEDLSMTLEALAQKEAAYQSGGKKGGTGKGPLNVTGTVDAISPILFNDSQEEPFAIMELYQPQIDGEVNNVKSAVAVIRGDDALHMHYAIHPGQSIALVGVISRKWKVPDQFQKCNVSGSIIPDLHERLICRVPDRVLLVSEAKAIRLNDQQEVAGLDMSLPSTVESLTSLRGIVKSVHFHDIRSSEGKKVRCTTHFITMTILNQTSRNDISTCQDLNAKNSLAPKLARIYLPKYSMSPNLTLGLQPGSILRAVNIHYISAPTSESSCEIPSQIDSHFDCFLACLRSTLAIERCAGETRLRRCNSWFVPRGNAFSLVSDYRITDICSDPFNSRSTEQLSAEENFRHQVESHLSLESRAKLNELLDHHRQASYVGLTSNGRGQNNGCARMRRICNQPNDGRSVRLTARNPYAEFFDHAHNSPFNINAECGNWFNKLSSFNRFHYCEATRLPRVVELKYLRNACAQNFINRVAIAMRSTRDNSRVTPGWTSCYYFQGLHLCQVLNDYAQMVDLRCKAWHDLSTDSSDGIYVWGIVESGHSSLFTADTCAVPICEMRNLRSRNKGLHESQMKSNGSPSWVQIGAVFVSCLCLGLSRNNLEVESVDSSTGEGDENKKSTGRKEYPCRFLPAMSVECKASNIDGHGFVFLVDKHIFIASVHIAGNPISSVKEIMGLNMNDHPSAMHADCMSVRQCLERTIPYAPNEDKVSIVGRLVRQRFAFRKVKSVEGNDGHLKKCFEGWSVIMSHINPFSEDILDAASALQAIEVKISVEFGASSVASSNIFSSAVREIGKSDDSINITPDQVLLGTAWWIVSGNSRSVPLLSGGLGIHPSVYVEIPSTSCTFSKLGYQRFRCNLNEITSYFVCEHSTSKSNEPTIENLHGTEWSGKFLPGMLTRRLRRSPPVDVGRNEIIRPIFSLLTTLQHQGGVPSASLAELLWNICSSLRVGDHVHLKPSLLRYIPNTKILGISFCRARVECTQCFRVLSGGVSPNNSHSIMSRERSIGTVDNPPKLQLSCPKGCSRSHAVVKWECSATIDDGTGQAKLYAERECALILLGCFAVEEVENGAWELEDGVFYQPSLPFSSHLKQCLRDTSTMARKKDVNLRNNRVKKRANHNEDHTSMLSLLPPGAKAEYLLHQHCRNWYQHNHSRKMDLLCRCKPLSEHITSVNQTDIQVAKAWISDVGLDFGNTSTATLPPLKLILEDACHASEDNLDDNLAAWHHLETHIKHRDLNNSKGGLH